MKIKERTDKFTDQGWDKLYSRLQQDGLLERKNTTPAEKEAAIIHEDFRDSINTQNREVNLKCYILPEVWWPASVWYLH